MPQADNLKSRTLDKDARSSNDPYTYEDGGDDEEPMDIPNRPHRAPKTHISLNYEMDTPYESRKLLFHAHKANAVPKTNLITEDTG